MPSSRFLALWWPAVNSSFERRLEFGRVGEGLISRWLQSRGHLVFPAYDKEIGSGKGPQLFSAAGDLVLPDILAFYGNRIQWVEAKHKSCFTWHRITRRWTTGIDIRHYNEYRQVSANTRLPVWLMFWHPQSKPDEKDVAYGCPPECPTGLFGNELEALAKLENHRSDKWGRTGMVYWAVDSLRLIARAESLSLAEWMASK